MAPQVKSTCITLPYCRGSALRNKRWSVFFDKNLTKLNAFKDPFIESISFHNDCLVLKVFATLFLLHEKCWDFDEHIKNVKVKDVNNQSWACNNFISWYKRQRIKASVSRQNTKNIFLSDSKWSYTVLKVCGFSVIWYRV